MLAHLPHIHSGYMRGFFAPPQLFPKATFQRLSDRF
jgi:hypothetical protein